MNLAIEYLTRNGRAKDFLDIPASIFIVDENDNKKVISIQKCFSSKKYVLIKHWILKDIDTLCYLPNFDEYKILKDDIFTSDRVILKDHKMLPYEQMLFPPGERQYSEGVRASCQEMEYSSFMDNYWNSNINKRNREKWLWSSFEDAYRIKVKPKYYNIRMEDCKNFYPYHWKKWLSWRKYMLDVGGDIASEILFYRYYEPYEEDEDYETKKLRSISPAFDHIESLASYVYRSADRIGTWNCTSGTSHANTCSTTSTTTAGWTICDSTASTSTSSWENW